MNMPITQNVIAPSATGVSRRSFFPKSMAALACLLSICGPGQGKLEASDAPIEPSSPYASPAIRLAFTRLKSSAAVTQGETPNYRIENYDAHQGFARGAVGERECLFISRPAFVIKGEDRKKHDFVGEVYCIDKATGEQLWRIEPPLDFVTDRLFFGWKLSYNKDAQELYVGTKKGQMFVVDPYSGSIKERWGVKALLTELPQDMSLDFHAEPQFGIPVLYAAGSESVVCYFGTTNNKPTESMPRGNMYRSVFSKAAGRQCKYNSPRFMSFSEGGSGVIGASRNGSGTLNAVHDIGGRDATVHPSISDLKLLYPEHDSKTGWDGIGFGCFHTGFNLGGQMYIATLPENYNPSGEEISLPIYKLLEGKKLEDFKFEYSGKLSLPKDKGWIKFYGMFSENGVVGILAQEEKPCVYLYNLNSPEPVWTRIEIDGKSKYIETGLSQGLFALFQDGSLWLHGPMFGVQQFQLGSNFQSNYPFKMAQVLSGETQRLTIENPQKVEARTWTSQQGSTFLGVLESYDPKTGNVKLTGDGKAIQLDIRQLSEEDVKFITNGGMKITQ